MQYFIEKSFQSAQSPFDTIRHVDGQGNEFWFARELMELLSYAKWDKFSVVIDNAKENLQTLSLTVIEHFFPVEVKTKGRPKLDYKLSRLACYHIALCCDSRGNDSVKAAKHYFAIKTREAEVVIPQQNDQLRELELRNSILEKQLALQNLDNAMIQMHGRETVLALKGMSDQIVREEIKTTEIVEPDTGRVTNILTAKQLKEAIKERTGQNIKTLKQVTDALRKAGRDDLLVPVRRSQTTEYIQPENLDEVIQVVFNKKRQMLLGE